MRLWKSWTGNIFTTLNMKNKESFQPRSENALLMPCQWGITVARIFYIHDICEYILYFTSLDKVLTLNINMNFENLSDPMGFELFPLLKLP